jgi:hypothetical protein
MNNIRPIAKCSRDNQRSRTRAAFVHALEVLVGLGWSLNRIAEHMGCSLRLLLDMRDGARPVYDWALAALPQEGRLAFSSALVAIGTPFLNTGSGL